MSICLTWFTNWLFLGKLKVYNYSGDFTRIWEGCGVVPVVDDVCETCEIVKR